MCDKEEQELRYWERQLKQDTQYLLRLFLSLNTGRCPFNDWELDGIKDERMPCVFDPMYPSICPIFIQRLGEGDMFSIIMKEIEKMIQSIKQCTCIITLIRLRDMGIDSCSHRFHERSFCDKWKSFI
jgi:hypothetical protein